MSNVRFTWVVMGLYMAFVYEDRDRFLDGLGGGALRTVATSKARLTRRTQAGVAVVAAVIAAASTAALTTGARAGVASGAAAGWSASLPEFTLERAGAGGGILVGGSIKAGPAADVVPVSIYLPPGFSSGIRYPVVYLVRGLGSPSSLAD